MAKSLLASYHTMMPWCWNDGLRRLFTVCPTVGTRNRPFWRKFKFDIKSLVRSPKAVQEKRRNKQTITRRGIENRKVNLAPVQFCPPVIFVSRHPNLKMPTQCDISSYTQPGSPDTNQSRGYSPNPFSGFLALINRLLTKYAATSSFIFKEASIIFRLTHSFFIRLFIPRQRKSYF